MMKNKYKYSAILKNQRGTGKTCATVVISCERARRCEKVVILVQDKKTKERMENRVLEYMKGAWPIGLKIITATELKK